jgi:Domain of unknown function (DUF4157)/OmpA family
MGRADRSEVASRAPLSTQPKLCINQPGDKYEHEADRVADQVMRSTPADTLVRTAPRTGIELMRKPSTSSASFDQREAPPLIHDIVSGSGQPLGTGHRAVMESKFGHDFSKVRIHNDEVAHRSADVINARAYTVANHLVFGAGQFAPNTPMGQRLISHELTHVLQQTAGTPSVQRAPKDPNDVTAAQSKARKLSKRIKDHTLVSKEVRAAIVHDMGFYQGLAKAAYVKELEAVLQRVGEPQLIGKAPYVPSLPTSLHSLTPDELCGGQKCFSDEDMHLTEEARRSDAGADLDKGYEAIVGAKDLKKGRMEWKLTKPIKEVDDGPESWSTQIQITFKPKETYRGKTVTFIQTLVESPTAEIGSPDAVAVVDWNRAKEEADPFYGADLDEDTGKWIAEGAPDNYKNAPSTADDPNAYLYDAPVTFRGHARVFESVALVPETGEILGSLRWGLTMNSLLGARTYDCSDLPTATYIKTLDKYYSEPQGYSYNPGHFSAILDGYNVGESDLRSSHKTQLDPIIEKALKSDKATIAVSGFGDGNEEDAMGVSQLRATSVLIYLLEKKFPRERIELHHFGSAWARYPISASEDRNRRVQIRIH